MVSKIRMHFTISVRACVMNQCYKVLISLCFSLFRLMLHALAWCSTATGRQGGKEASAVCEYAVCKLFSHETRYCTIKKECLAIKWALDTLKYYLIGKKFVLETDHRSLQWLHHLRDINSRITQWHLSLQPYRFTVRYKAGKDNVIADFLSCHDMDAAS